MGDVGLDCRLRGWQRRHQKLAFHAGEPMSRHVAKIHEVSAAARTKRHAGACSASRDPLRTRILVGENNIVLGALAIEQDDLHHLSLDSGKHWVDLALDRATDTDVDHSPLSNS